MISRIGDKEWIFIVEFCGENENYALVNARGCINKYTRSMKYIKRRTRGVAFFFFFISCMLVKNVNYTNGDKK